MVAILGMVIADDEKKICKLIEYLVNWDEIGIQLLGTAYDGITALQLINEKSRIFFLQISACLEWMGFV
jgi:two-component system response regulator YesN